MLNKRAHILFDEKLWKKLSEDAKENNTSIGAIVRQALENRYQDQEYLKKRAAAIKHTLKIRPKPFKGRIDYKELINAGRKY